PVKVPMIDIVTVGSGGGGNAGVAPQGGGQGGARGAGAAPPAQGPGRGGGGGATTHRPPRPRPRPPPPPARADGLDRDAAERGLGWLGQSLGLDALRTAEGILEITAWNQANAIRQVSVKRGLDPREYTLVAFGGAGPLLAGRLLDLLGLRAALIPPSPGNLSALGLLVVDVKNDYVQTYVERHDRLDVTAINAHLARLE